MVHLDFKSTDFLFGIGNQIAVEIKTRENIQNEKTSIIVYFSEGGKRKMEHPYTWNLSI